MGLFYFLVKFSYFSKFTIYSFFWVVDLPTESRKERPQTRPSKLTENDITEITEKVRKMNGR